MAVIKDVIDNPTGRFTLGGWTLERTFVVTGVAGEGHEKLIHALETSGVPKLGDAHPSANYTYLRESIPTAEDPDTVRIRLIYTNPANPSYRQEVDITGELIEVGGTLSQIQTNLDRNDAVMYVDYTYPADYPHNPDLQSKAAPTQGGLVNKFVPQHTIVKSRLEYSSPSAIARDFVDTVNAAGWNLDPSAAVGTWLCTGIKGRSNDGGVSFIVTYSFQYRADTWATDVYWIDPHDGHPPADLVAGTGKKTYELYNIMNFNLLGL